MNIRELEALLRQIRLQPPDYFDGTDVALRLDHAIAWCVSQQRATLKRRAVMKHRADERRELLR